MDAIDLKGRIIKYDHHTSGAKYRDREIHAYLMHIPTVDNGSLKHVGENKCALTGRMYEAHIFTKSGEYQAFRKYDVLKTLLSKVRRRLESSPEQLPTSDDRILFENAIKQRDLIISMCMRMVGSMLANYLKDRKIDCAEYFEYEAESMLSLLTAINNFNYKKGYRLTTFFYNISFNNLITYEKKKSKYQKKFINNLCFKQLNSGSDHKQGNIGEPRDNGLSPVEVSDHNELSIRLNEIISNLNPQEAALIQTYFFKSGSDSDTFHKAANFLGISEMRMKITLRSAYRKLRRYSHRLQQFV